MRVTDALNKDLRNAQSVCLHRGEVREGGKGRTDLGAAQLAKVIDATEVYGEVRRYRQMIHIAAKFEAVAAFDERKVVAYLVALLYTIHKRERLAAKEGKTRNVDGHITATRTAREVIQESTARVLITRLVDFVVAQ